MRILVACPDCARRFRAKEEKVGTRFHCLCGRTLEVPVPRSHDAAVVRCSSCGAPRENQSPSCGHCGADYTLHERDLHSVCPACLTRISDRARYCHHCGASQHAENDAGVGAELSCPVCQPDRELRSRRLTGALSVLECPGCLGMWLGLESIEALLAAEAKSAGLEVRQSTPAREQPETPRGYIKCLVCRGLMTRRNLARGQSGVVVDVCGHHGVWFDADELAQLLSWTRAGGLEELRLDLARLPGSTDQPRRRQAISADVREARESASPPVRAEWPLDLGRSARSDLAWIQLAVAVAARLLRGL